MPAGLERHPGDVKQLAPTAAGARSRGPATAYVTAGIAAIVVYFFLPDGWQNAAFAAIGFSSVVAIVAGAIRNRPANPWAWHLLAFGQLLFVSRGSLWTIYEVVPGRRSPFVSGADVAYLAAYIPLTAGLLLIVRARRPGRDISSLIDAAIITLAAAVAAWIFLMAPVASRGGASEIEMVVPLAHATADVLLIAIAATFVLTDYTRVFSARLIGASLVALITSDILYIPATLGDSYQTGSLIDIGWLLSYVLWGMAALHPSMRVLTEPARDTEGPRFSRRRLVVDSLAVLAIPVMWGIQTLRGAPRYNLVVVAASTLASLLVIARMGGLFGALQAAALHDPLTGLPNRRLLLDRIGQAFRRGQRAGTPVVVLFLDLHGLKNVNDRFGHEAGDGALIEIGRRISSCVRGSDTVARLGGDEFVIVCEALETGGAERVAARIRAAVARPLPIRGEDVAFSVDVGIAVETTPAGSDVSALLRAADHAMYQAKASTPKPQQAS